MPAVIMSSKNETNAKLKKKKTQHKNYLPVFARKVMPI